MLVRTTTGWLALLLLIATSAFAQEHAARPTLGDTLPPLAGPFPPGESEGPAPTPVKSECKPVLLFRGLCFYDDVKPNDRFCRYPTLVGAGFQTRGYQTERAGPSSTMTKDWDAPTFDAMMKGLKKSIADQKDFCKCPEDQLVIYIASHGTDESIFYKAGKDDTDHTTSWADFAKALLDSLDSKTVKKVYLILESCGSGAVFNHLPPGLNGMHILSSTNRGCQSSTGEFEDSLATSLADNNIKTWADFVKEVKKKAAGTDFTPKWGDANTCQLKVSVKKISYSGTDAGKLGSGVDIMVNESRVNVAAVVNGPGASAEPKSGTVYERSCSDPAELRITAVAETTHKGGAEDGEAQANGAKALPPDAKSTAAYACPSKKSFTIDVPLTAGPNATATGATISVEIEVDVTKT